MRSISKCILIVAMLLLLGQPVPVSADLQPKRVLMECCVSTDCPACSMLYLTIEELKQAHPPAEFICIRYFVGNGMHFSNSETEARHSYYVVGQSYPTTFFNGENRMTGAWNASWYEQIIDEELGKTSLFELNAELDFAANKAVVHTKVKLHGNYHGMRPTLRVALVEDDVTTIMGAPFTDITRRLADAGDVTIVALGQEQDFVIYFDISSIWELHDLRAVSFLQINDTREVLQSASAEPPAPPPPPPYGKISGHVTAVIHTDGGEEEVVLAPILDIYLTRPFWWIDDPFQAWDAGLLAGYNSIRVEEGTAAVDDSYILNLNLNLRYNFLSRSRISPFIGAGPGYYYARGSSEAGVDIIGGIDVPLTAGLSLELGTYMHFLFDTGKTRFLQAGAGLVYAFR